MLALSMSGPYPYSQRASGARPQSVSEASRQAGRSDGAPHVDAASQKHRRRISNPLAGRSTGGRWTSRGKAAVSVPLAARCRNATPALLGRCCCSNSRRSPSSPTTHGWTGTAGPSLHQDIVLDRLGQRRQHQHYSSRVRSKNPRRLCDDDAGIRWTLTGPWPAASGPAAGAFPRLSRPVSRCGLE